MIANLEQYSSIKESTVNWIGEVPPHWQVRRLKSVAKILNGATPSSRVPEYWDGDIIWITPEDLGSLTSPYVRSSARRITPDGYQSCGTTIARAGSVAISTRAPIGHIGILTADGCVNQGCKLLVPDESIDTAYLFYLLDAGQSELKSLGCGTTFAELSRGALGDFVLPIPSRPEQADVVRFLDHADRRIQRYIRAKQQLIALLEEHKQAIIHQAVTGQIDVRTGRPYSLYRPSGTDALGRIPKDWEVLPLAAIGTHKSITGKPSLELLSVYLVRGVIPFSEERGKRTNVTSEDRSKYQEVVPGDFVLNNQQAWRGSVGVSRYHGIVSPAYLVLSISDSMHSEFADLIFRSRVMVAQYVACSRGVGTIQRNIYWPHLKRVVIPFPPRSEQIRIADYLREIGNGFTTTAARILREIELMKELRNCLITVSVTGKIDVRNMAGLC